MALNSVAPTLAAYWRAYGGVAALCRSPFFLLAMVLTAVLYPIWIEPDWWELPMGMLPDLLGFSLGAFAFIVGFGNERFLNRMAGREPGEAQQSPYMVVTSAMLHFILCQVLALFLGLAASAAYLLPAPDWFAQLNQYLRPAFWGGAFFIFVYALTLVAASALAAFEVVRWFDDARTKERERPRPAPTRGTGSVQ